MRRAGRPTHAVSGESDGPTRDDSPINEQPRWYRLHAWLVQPVHCSTLGVFRALYGICMFFQARRFGRMFDEFASSKAVFPYPALDMWLPASPLVGEWVLLVVHLAAICTAIGACTRVATPVLFLSFTYLFLNCVSNHNNHYILICHVSGAASFTNWGCWFSVDSLVAHWRRGAAPGTNEAATVPYWNLLILQFMFAIPYCFGAVAKFNEDWLLRAQPLKVREWVWSR